ncbi:uncharacterized protein LOC122659283 [Telopea speciosissima]|uniref:uncharacterized protein LOC122659283 n=1 Tax=Telopea speciosissima TaxID=54955 RepID=UPI001CC7A769|nr:uncharacterized protein LOC122659283 [Telopea speciosissima]
MARDFLGRSAGIGIDLGVFLGFPPAQHHDLETTRVRRTFTEVAQPWLPEIETLPSPIQDGNLTRVKILQAAYVEQVNKHKFSLIGRLNFRSTTMEELRRASKQWALKGEVIMCSIGKGFVVFHFSNADDMTNIWRRGPLRVGGRSLHFQQWHKDFIVEDQALMHRLSWIHLLNLPQEYWHSDILLSITKVVGRPIAIDKKTMSSTYGHFARVCVDIDDSLPRVEEVYVEREQAGLSELFVFRQPVEFEAPPTRCIGCKHFGHQVDACPRKEQVVTVAKEVPSATFGNDLPK